MFGIEPSVCVEWHWRHLLHRISYVSHLHARPTSDLRWHKFLVRRSQPHMPFRPVGGQQWHLLRSQLDS